MERVNLTLSAGAVAACLALATPHFAGGLALGAALEALNLRALNRSAQAMFAGTFGGGGPWVALLALRFVVLAAGIGLALAAGVHPIGLLVGLSLAMPATLISALLNRPAVIPQEALPALDPDDPSWDEWSVWRAGELPSVEPGDDQ